MGIAHFDQAPAHEHELGHIQGRWTMLGAAAGCEKVGVRRIQLPAGGWSTPAHEYGMRDSGDACYYSRSNKIAFRGLGLVARLERLDYWDGED